MAMMPALVVVTTAGSVTTAYGVGNCAILSWTRHMPRSGMVRGKQSPARLASFTRRRFSRMVKHG
jgi:hypothetical protein